LPREENRQDADIGRRGTPARGGAFASSSRFMARQVAPLLDRIGSEALVFGFRAVQVCFHEGAYRALRVERAKLQLMSEGRATSQAAAETGWLCDRIGTTFPRFAA
jgi:hypothetical protein